MKCHAVLLMGTCLFAWSACGDDDEPRTDTTTTTDVADATEDTTTSEDTSDVALPDTAPPGCVPFDCDDDDPCTLDLCAATGACQHVVIGGACDDGDACTRDDRCVAGACTGLPIAGCGGVDACDDGACTGGETCATCPADCSPLGAGACGGSCDPATRPTTCAANFVCVPSAPGGSAGTCLGQATPCDPIAQTGCAAGQTCRTLAGPDIAGRADMCLPAGGRGAGAPCDAHEQCGAGLLCAFATCRAPCDPTTPTCPGGACRDVSAAFFLLGGSLGACDTACGDGTCGAGETCATCASDCGACDRCLDGVCGATESCASCAPDCGLCRACGNGICQIGETCLDCPADCGACALCGDGACAPTESCASCVADCGTCLGACGDAVCSPLENCTTCGAADCGVCPAWSCGDGACDPTEDCVTCAADCGMCQNICGDGDCQYGETCASCPGDCALLAGVACTGSCDPTAATTGCAANRACVPTAAGRVAATAIEVGDGVCARACTSDGDCQLGAACLALAGLEAAGVCGPACAPGAIACADGATCVPKPDAPDEGVCLADGVCNPLASDACDAGGCVPLAGMAELGACLPGCHSRASDCADGACLTRTAQGYREGVCLGQATACNPASQTGCGVGQTCTVIVGPGVGGVARACTSAVGTVDVGGACDVVACKPGLLCRAGACRRPCTPGQTSTCGGVCPDLSAIFGLSAGTLGLCP